MSMKRTFYSSLLFSTNAITSLLAGYYLYSLCFVALSMSSLFLHGLQQNPIHYCIYYWVDQVCIAAVVILGGIKFWQKTKTGHPLLIAIIIGSFLFVVASFIGGKALEKMCFDPDKDVANLWHSIIHLVSSVGHHLIAVI